MGLRAMAGEERTYAFVDSYRDGWAWSVPLSPTRRQCTVMIDADRTTVRKVGLSSLYDRELQKAVGIGKRLVNARRIGRPWACDASVYDCVRLSTAVLFLSVTPRLSSNPYHRVA